MNVLSMARAFVHEHGGAALVTVVAASGSTPRHAGTHMLVSAEGELCGSIGGGRVELQVSERARAVALGEPPQLFKVNLVQDVAMCCGGTMEFFIEPVQELLPLLDAIEAEHRERRPVCLATDVQSGGKSLLPALGEAGLDRATMQFREILNPVERLILFGCGHLSRAIGPMARLLDFYVVVCDDNETSAVDDEVSWAHQVVSSFALHDVEKQLGPIGNSDFLLILTRDHAMDQAIVEETLARARDFAYVGLIGSLGKIGRFKKRILAKQIISEEDWALLRAPMGLDIRAETPQEIAVSIMGELIALRNRRRAS